MFLALFVTGIVSEFCCVGMALCRNGDMSDYDLSGYVIYGDKRTDDQGLSSTRLYSQVFCCGILVPFGLYVNIFGLV